MNLQRVIFSSVSFIIISIFIFHVQCLNLDPFLFKGESLDNYTFDSYTGKRECADAIDSLGSLSSTDYREIKFNSGNESIYAVLLGKQSRYTTSDTIILYFHGNTGHIDYYWAKARLLYATQYPVLIIDYQGFGKSSGKPSEDGLYNNGLSALDYIRDTLGNPSVVVYAYSLGSLVGCEMASKHQNYNIIKLILESPIGSAATIVEDGSFLNLPSSYVTTYSGNNADKIKSVKVPFLWIYGTKDETLDQSTNGLLIWNNYSGVQGYSIMVPGAGHSNIQKILGFTTSIKCVRDFISGNAAKNSKISPK